MKQVNSVQLEGLVESCRIVGEVDGKTVAKLSVVTLHPNESAPVASVPLSSRLDKFRHDIRVSGNGDLARNLQMLERELKTEKAAGEADLMSLHPCSVSGVLRSTPDGEMFVDVAGKGFALTDRVKTRDNNLVRISGSVLAVSYTDESARLQVGTPEGPVSVFFPKSANRNGWDAVSSGKIKKGDLLTLTGPLAVSEFTDGRKYVRTCMLTPHSIQRHKLERKHTPGQSL